MIPDPEPTPGVGFAAALRARRRAAGLTQQELAVQARLGVRTVRELERGRAVRPQRGTVDLLADALGLAGDERTRFVTMARGGPRAETMARGGSRVETMPRGGSRAGTVPSAWPAAGPAVADTTADPAVARAANSIALPPALPLVGRDADLRDLAGLLPAYDVVLIGLAGVGKSCLALAVAHRVAGQFPGGAAGIAISDVSEPDDVLASTAAVFGVACAADLSERCAGKPTLLMVDGADRAPEACATALTWLRAHAPALRILVTSRQPVDLPGVVTWPVAPLEVPPRRPTSDLAELSAYPAVALFLARLRQVRRHPVTPADVPVLGELVRRLGGLPLAIELAAARGRVLELPEILDRYGHRVLDLGDQRPDGQTLRDAVSASYRLLDATEQVALERLAVFAGRWSVDLAEELLRGVTDDVEAVLDRLVGLGLVSVRATGRLRFRLLDVVHDFALERCADGGHLERVRSRHARLFAALAARTAPELAGPGMPAAVALLDHLLSDLLGALQHAVDTDPPTALRLAAALTRWWRFRGRDAEGRTWLRRLLDDPRAGEAEPRVRAWAQLGAATLAIEHGEGLTELDGARRSLATFADLGDVNGQLAAHDCLGALFRVVGGYDDARRHGEAMLDLATRTGRAREILVAHCGLARHDVRNGDLAGARRRLETVARLAGDDVRLRAVALVDAAEVARLDGRYDEAVELGRRALALLTDVGDPGHRVRALGTVGLAHAESGAWAEADAVRSTLTELGSAAEGTQAMIGGYLARARGERAYAAKLFETAAATFFGRHDVRDVVEALVGVAASTDGPADREEALAQLRAMCRRSGHVLLPRDHAMLADG